MRTTVRRIRQRTPALVVAVACPRCSGRGRHLSGDDYHFPVEVECRTCSGRGLVAPPKGSRAAAIVARVAGEAA